MRHGGPYRDPDTNTKHRLNPDTSHNYRAHTRSPHPLLSSPLCRSHGQPATFCNCHTHTEKASAWESSQHALQSVGTAALFFHYSSILLVSLRGLEGQWVAMLRRQLLRHVCYLCSLYVRRSVHIMRIEIMSTGNSLRYINCTLGHGDPNNYVM